MHIIHIASECAPIAKAGGLGDVVYGLAQELIKLGHRVEVILPKYDTIDYSLLENLHVHTRDLWSYDGPYRCHNTIWSATVHGLTLWLLEPHHQNYFFSRGFIYGCADDTERFLYFSRAAMEFLFKSGTCCDVIHLHDWPVAVCSVLYQDMYRSLGFPKTKIAMTIHNLAHQGQCTPKQLNLTGLKAETYLTQDKLQDPVQLSHLNLLKGGIVYSEIVTTVSPTYEQEIQTPEGGHGLHLLLKKFQFKLTGILNGIDADLWNPQTDPHLKSPFSYQDLSGKSKNKEALRSLLGLSQENVPLVACISRLVHQKNPFLIAHAFRHILSIGGQCVILGSAPSKEMEDFFIFLQSEYATSTHGVILLTYDESLSHLIYGSADMFIVPSLFEPCGLTQLLALRYGAIPIVRKTGGLADTVFDRDTSSKPLQKRNGFVFEESTKEDLCKAISRAFDLWNHHPKEWIRLVKQCMEQDYSWKVAAKKYIEAYLKSQEPS